MSPCSMPGIHKIFVCLTPLLGAHVIEADFQGGPKLYQHINISAGLDEAQKIPVFH